MKRIKQSFLVTLCVIVARVGMMLTSEVTAQCPTLNPPICSSGSDCNGGTCVRGVCQCTGIRQGERCEDPTNKLLKIGNIVITQAGLDFAPIEYFEPINNAYEDAKAGALAASEYNGPCTNQDGDSTKSFKVEIAPLTESHFIRSNLIQSSVKFEITNNGLRVSAMGDYVISKARLNLWGGAYCCPCTTNCGGLLCAKVCSKTDAGDWIDFAFKVLVSADIALQYNSAVEGVSATVSNVQLAFDDSSLGATLVCPTTPFNFISNMVKSYFEQVKTQIEPTLKPTLQSALTDTANRITARYQGLQTYAPQEGMFLQYKVTGVTVVPATYITITLEGKVIFTHFLSSPGCRLNVTYADTAGDFALLPPSNWVPVTKKLSPSGLFSPILAGSRITRSFFNAMVWANFQDPTKRSRDFIFRAENGLAAAATFQFTTPYFIIPNDASQGRLKVSVNGRGTFSCPPLKPGTVLAADFTGLEAAFALTYDNTPPDPAIAFQVIPQHFDVDSIQNPASPGDPALLNTALLKNALIGGLNFNAPALDRFLIEKGNGVLVLPPDLRASFPDAQLQIISQGNAGSPAINGESGYIEMVNRCACSSSSTPIPNQGADGVVNVCPFSFLTKDYCSRVLRRRRLSSSSEMEVEDEEEIEEEEEAMKETFGERDTSSGTLVDSPTPIDNNLISLAVNLDEEQETSNPENTLDDQVAEEGEEEFSESLLEKTKKSMRQKMRRTLDATQQQLDLTTVIGSLGSQCVTRAPTQSPTTAQPTNQPTLRPSRLPTTFDGLDATRDVCENGKNGCFYERNVFLFVCKRGYVENVPCRYENTDIYCCPIGSTTSEVVLSLSAMFATLISLMFVLA